MIIESGVQFKKKGKRGMGVSARGGDVAVRCEKSAKVGAAALEGGGNG